MPRSNRVGYYRVSLAADDEVRERAIDALKDEGVEDDALFGDATHGDNSGCQPDLEACLSMIAHGDTLVIASLDRLGPRIDLIRKTLAVLQNKNVTLRLLDGYRGGTIPPEAFPAAFDHWLRPAEELERRLRADRNQEAARADEVQALREAKKRGRQDHAAIKRLIGKEARKPTARERRLAEIGYKDFFAITPEQLDLLVVLVRDKKLSRLKAAETLGLSYDAVRNYIDKQGNEQDVAARMRRDAAQGGPERRLHEAAREGRVPKDVLPAKRKLRPASKTRTLDRRKKPKTGL